MPKPVTPERKTALSAPPKNAVSARKTRFVESRPVCPGRHGPAAPPAVRHRRQPAPRVADGGQAAARAGLTIRFPSRNLHTYRLRRPLPAPLHAARSPLSLSYRPRPMRTLLLICLAWIGLGVPGVLAQRPDADVLPTPLPRQVPPRFEHLTLEDGLSQSLVYRVYQD